MSKENSLRKEARENGYILHKGYRHEYDGMNGRRVFRDIYGNRVTGYMLTDMKTKCNVWGSCDHYGDYLWTLTDVEFFLHTL